MNHLQHETSPYLLQHATNPVEWYAWKPEAFERAGREDKPIVLSVGYSTCHWCHVMERESFEDSDTAAFMNTHFVNIKVDREERPDVDQIYMNACQLIHGSGGWPLNCFLLPDGRPFFAGTYYPADASGQRSSWLQLLNNMYRAYRDRRVDVIKQAEFLTDRIQSGTQVFLGDELVEEQSNSVFQPELSANIFENLSERFDTAKGGFGGTPKFPGTMNLQFLLRYYHYSGEVRALEHVSFSLRQMIKGGIYDQLGGGFARYAVDQSWLVPHFEKMLYDNALLVALLSDTYRKEIDPLFARAIRETLAFIEREFSNPEGGFYSALDADSEGVEGKFYVWSWKEVHEVLGDKTPLFAAAYGLSEEGNWEGHNILWRARPVAEVALELGIEEAAAEQQLQRARQQLLDHRSQRIRPGLDDKQLLSWNALMISAYCRAFLALGDDAFRQRALSAISFVQENMSTPNGSLWHTYKDGHAQYQAFLDDYAYWINALLDAYLLDFELNFIDQAVTLTEFVLTHFLDESDNLFYFTAASQADIPLRPKELYDNAMPSGNAVMVGNLLRLANLTGRLAWKERAKRMLHKMVDSVQKYPTAFGQWAIATLQLSFPQKEIAIVGPAAQQKGRQLLKELYPELTIMAHEQGDLPDYPLLNRRRGDPDTYFFVCQDFQCQLPVDTLEEAKSLL